MCDIAEQHVTDLVGHRVSEDNGIKPIVPGCRFTNVIVEEPDVDTDACEREDTPSTVSGTPGGDAATIFRAMSVRALHAAAAFRGGGA